MKSILAIIYAIVGFIIVTVTLISPAIFWIIYSQPLYIILFLVTPGVSFWIFTMLMVLFDYLFE